MNDNKEAVSVLAPLFRATHDEPCPILLLGAGASFRSGVPTAADAVRQIARRIYSERELQGNRPPERVKPSEWQTWLQSFAWFIHGDERLAENFPLVVKHLLTPAEFRKQVLLDLMQPRNGLSSGYKFLADFVMRGLVHTVLTTNFDPYLPDALRQRQPHIRQIHEVHRGPGDFAEFGVFNKCQIIWLHGRAEQYSDQNAAGETDALDTQLVSLLRPLLSSPVVVVGYRGSEFSVMEGIFGQDKEGRLDFPNGVYWCVRQGETPHPHVEALQRRLGSNFRLLHISGFDELFADLGRELEGESRYLSRDVSAANGAPLAFDEQIVEDASLDDLDLDLTLTVMRDYCSKLGRTPVTSATLLQLLQEQGLVDATTERVRITAGALLVFGKAPQKFFPHAVVSVTEAGKKREVYDGNLISQHRQLLQKLESPDVNPLLRVKKRRQHDERPAYPPRVLVELLVNLLVHRDYEASAPATIEVHPGSEIILSNPGGLTSRVAKAVSIEDDGRFTATEGLTDQRNPSLCDVFFGISAMERAGTGLVDTARMMLEHGGNAAFFSHAEDKRFEVRIAQPRASAGSRTVAQSQVPTGLYVFNVLPFNVVPDSLSLVQLKMPWRERPRSFDFSECGTFAPVGSTLWSFVPLPILTSLLDPIIDREACVTVGRDQVESSTDSRRVLSWLLRNHWERHLSAFRDQGLMLESGHKHRAYFEARDKDSRTVIWDSPQRRGNRRDVVKKRRDGVRGWFENEGFGYEIVDMGGLWCVRIKPFYMFTGGDGRTPLPSFARASKATSRIKFDRNKNVEADLQFWSSLLSQGAETINIGHQHVDDLILDASFLTVEVPEIGLENDESEHQNRMSA